MEARFEGAQARPAVSTPKSQLPNQGLSRVNCSPVSVDTGSRGRVSARLLHLYVAIHFTTQQHVSLGGNSIAEKLLLSSVTKIHGLDFENGITDKQANDYHELVATHCCPKRPD